MTSTKCFIGTGGARATGSCDDRDSVPVSKVEEEARCEEARKTVGDKTFESAKGRSGWNLGQTYGSLRLFSGRA